jgi:hypothetical protein
VSNIRAVHVNLKKLFGLTEPSVNVVSSVPTIRVGFSPNLSKQSPDPCPTGRKEFHQNVLNGDRLKQIKLSFNLCIYS